MCAARPTADPKVARLIEEAVALHRAGNLEGAELAYRRVLKRNPRDPDSLHLLGVVRGQRGDPQEGATHIKRALALRDDFPDAHMNLALILWQNLGDPDAAERHVRRALHYRKTPTNYNQLGNLLRARGRHDEALAAFRGAMESDPRNPEGYLIYARALRMTNDAATMLQVAEAGLKIAPQHPVLHLMTSEAFFALGRLKEGWHAYRWRFHSAENRIPPKAYQLPMWSGEALADRAILVWTEQGPGDEIMYASMFADVIAAAKRCVIQCSARLAPIMRRSFPGTEIFDRDLTAEELEGLDVQSPAGSLGEWLRLSFADFPRRNSYLKADEPLRDALRAKYEAGSSRPLVVGIAWKSAVVIGAAEKSVDLLSWGPILQVPGITFVNLQYGDCALELEEARKGFGAHIVQDATIDPLRDMDAFAAQVAAMDLVVTSSNTAAHVAGALGVPALCMLSTALGRGRRWYWFAEHPDCPWYPSVRRLNQRRDGEWLEVIRDVGLALVDDVAARGVAVATHLRAVAKAFAEIQRAEDAQAYYLRLAAEEGSAAPSYLAVADLKIAALDAEGAFEFLDRAIAADPTFVEAYNTKGVVLGRLNRFDDAIAVYKTGLAQNERSPELHNSLGIALSKLGRGEEALHHFGEALACAGGLSAAARDSIALNYSGALDAAGRTDEAITMLNEIIGRNPGDVDAHYNLSRHLLAVGRLSEGWPEFEWRLKRPNVFPYYETFPHVKRWSGEDLAGKRLLIWTEQGIGDQILTASMVPDAIDVAEHVTVLTTARLVPLFRRSFPKASVDELQKPLPKSALDPRLSFQMSISDLGRAFRPDLASFPSRPRYLKADEEHTRALRSRYQGLHPDKLIVGIAWSSHGNPEMGWLKSNNLEAWGPILTTPGIVFVNLQYGDCAAEIARVRDRLGIEIFTDPKVDALRDMDTFAAQVAAMDLVISTSNSAVHCAGGLGVPTWVLAPEGRGRHWYWFKNRDVSPWYPSLRFVQGARDGGWDSIIARCGQDLGAWMHTRRKIGNS